MTDLPPPNRIPRDCGSFQVIPVQQYSVSSWSPLPAGKGPPTQVHLLLESPGRLPILMRFKSAKAVDTMIAALQRHRNDVWPEGGAQK